MKIAVIGGTGLIGSQVVDILKAAGHEAEPHALSTGVDLLTGEGLASALAGADVVVNLTNSPTFDDASLAFFRQTMDNLLEAAAKEGVGHAVVLSIVGAELVPELDYYRAKVLQEDILKEGPVPYSIVRATQFFEFMDAVLSWTADEETVRLPATPLRPIAAADVAQAVADVAAGSPLGGTRNVAGADVFPLDELGRITLAARGDKRTVTTDDQAGMFSAVKGDAIIPKDGDDARIAPTRYRNWLAA
ncbi:MULTISPECIES: SDR family oxidoreductase [Streptomyces]|uniref:SDR family oxidoreductase n=1 Tax=Streptomyces TaxID=1883 RepID=UPI000F54E125|nr:NAD(P)H-binding protein [Streptomyces sp. ADI97-07]RPK77161.1 NmrA-like family protein [Streptomyces sp. ADI97-07]